ncbi:hypothetical protein BDV95DRAFT_614890 [Massariosphaeria phaeospora]|uniref:BTB domain-containing protein n=1 Tax=Massariosphaeria phaeospora TaxID=100035 RepID=A0A7C8IJZ6_9PLEO|nr:hypothetical protein BDV95DRAFT_614890 [Massariosphaeria phaeospora]
MDLRASHTKSMPFLQSRVIPLLVHGKTYNVHEAILEGRTKWFSRPQQHPIVIENRDPRIIQIYLEYLYTGLLPLQRRGMTYEWELLGGLMLFAGFVKDAEAANVARRNILCGLQELGPLAVHLHPNSLGRIWIESSKDSIDPEFLIAVACTLYREDPPVTEQFPQSLLTAMQARRKVILTNVFQCPIDLYDSNGSYPIILAKEESTEYKPTPGGFKTYFPQDID